MTWSGAWSTQQLVEFLAAIAGSRCAATAAQTGIERVAEALEADVAVLYRDDGIVASIGFGVDPPSVDQLKAAGAGAPLFVPDVGQCPVLTARVAGRQDAHLLLARRGDGFTLEEETLVRGMARVMSSTFRQLELVEEVTARQHLFEQLSAVQGALAQRRPLQEVLDAITIGARELLGSDIAGLRIVDAHDQRYTLMVSSHGFPDLELHRIRRLPLTVGLMGEVMTAGEPVRVDHYRDATSPFSGLNDHLGAAMAAPVRENGQTVGALLVARRPGNGPYAQRDEQVLTAFADHVSLALTDAHTVHAVDRARHDSLTGLASRGLFLDRVDAELADADEQQRPTALLFVDLDDFKSVNDRFSHQAGDELLVTVAGRLRAAVRADDLPARMGGDEFAVLLPATDAAEAEAIAHRVLARLGQPVSLDNHCLTVGASIGVAVTSPGGPSSATARQDLLRHADLAMYEAKSSGGRRAAAFTATLAQNVSAGAALRRDLHDALERGQLHLALQPVVDLATGRPAGAEALLRWTHPLHGVVSPRTFIPVAEQSDLIVGLGRWVLREACRRAVAWPRQQDGSPLQIGINISGRQLEDPGLVTDIADTLRDTGLDPARLVLEITESMLITDATSNLDRLRALKDLGLRLAIDDFGTGYSSLAYLTRLPVDILKIDRSFIADSVADERSAALTACIVQLGRALDLVVIAEGIETAEQRDWVRGLGCQFAQGYALGRPQDPSLFPPADMTGMVPHFATPPRSMRPSPLPESA